MSVDGGSQRGKVCGRPEPAGPDIVGRGAWSADGVERGESPFPGARKWVDPPALYDYVLASRDRRAPAPGRCPEDQAGRHER